MQLNEAFVSFRRPLLPILSQNCIALCIIHKTNWHTCTHRFKMETQMGAIIKFNMLCYQLSSSLFLYFRAFQCEHNEGNVINMCSCGMCYKKLLIWFIVFSWFVIVLNANETNGLFNRKRKWLDFKVFW